MFMLVLMLVHMFMDVLVGMFMPMFVLMMMVMRLSVMLSLGEFLNHGIELHGFVVSLMQIDVHCCTVIQDQFCLERCADRKVNCRLSIREPHFVIAFC